MEATKAGGGQQSETVLANFFNSLLTKKSGSPAKASPGIVICASLCNGKRPHGHKILQLKIKF